MKWFRRRRGQVSSCFECGQGIETVFGYRFTPPEDIKCFACTYKQVPPDERGRLLPIHHVGDWTPRTG